ncbi:hypothetical protein LX36DRAFT_745328 [Colletotrichum falcatum]|nr:hypothetical protein LX36DRAFT_745328 [Colletotrichum falcatum]
MFRVLSCFWSLNVSAANVAAYGALLDNHVHASYGQRGIAALASACYVVVYAIIAQNPQYPALVVVFVLAGFSNGTGCGAHIGNMERAD